MNKDICNKHLYTINGSLNKYYKTNFNMYKDTDIYCVFMKNLRFADSIFPYFLGDSIDKIVDKIVMFITNNKKVYYSVLTREKDEWGDFMKVILINDDGLLYYYFMKNIKMLKKQNKIGGAITKEEQYYKKVINDDFKILKTLFQIVLQGNNLTVVKTKLMMFYVNYHLNDKIKNKFDNYREAYKYVFKKYGNPTKFFGRYAKHIRKITLDNFKDFKSTTKLTNKEIIKQMKLKKVSGSLNHYLNLVPSYYNKTYIRKAVEKKLSKL